MLEEHRIRKFFGEDPEAVTRRLEQFVEERGGTEGSGFRSLAVYSFTPPSPHSPRFLNVSVRDRSESSHAATGNVTVRYREEPGETYETLAADLLEFLQQEVALYDHPDQPGSNP